jgi:hypothetical protein
MYLIGVVIIGFEILIRGTNVPDDERLYWTSFSVFTARRLQNSKNSFTPFKNALIV